MGFLRHARGGWLVAAGLASIAGFGLLFLAFGTRGPVHLMGSALGGGVVLTLVGLVRWWREPAAGDPRAARRRRVRVLLAALAGLTLLGGVAVTYALGAIEAAELYCHRASQAPTLREREVAWQEAQPRWERARLFDRILACERAGQEREELARGICPFYPADDGPCDCSGQRWPEDWRGGGPAKCVRGQGLMADDWPEGRKERWFLPWPP